MRILLFPLLWLLMTVPALATVIQRQDRPTVNNTRTFSPSVTRRAPRPTLKPKPVARPVPKPRPKPVAKKPRPQPKRRTIAKPALRRHRQPRRTAYRSSPPRRKTYHKPPRRSYRRPPVTVARSKPVALPSDKAPVSQPVIAPTPQGVPKFHSRWLWPLPVNASITSRFGWSKDRRRFHSGLTLAAPSGVQVLSVAAGRVVFAGGDDHYGLSVIVEHGDNTRTRYSHLSAIQTQMGHRVVRGQSLGMTGSTGNINVPRLGFEFLTRQTDGSFQVTDPGISLDVARVVHVQGAYLARTRR